MGRRSLDALYDEALIIDLKRDLEAHRRALDDALVTSQLWRPELKKDPRAAINTLMAWSEGIGKYFALDRLGLYRD